MPAQQSTAADLLGRFLVGGAMVGIVYLGLRALYTAPATNGSNQLPPSTHPVPSPPLPPPTAPTPSSSAPLLLPPALAVKGCPAAGSRVLLVGDSLAYGLKPLFVADAKRCSTQYATAVKGGTRVVEWSHKMGPLISAHKPTAIMFSLGGNSFGFTPLETVIEHLDRFLAAIPPDVWTLWIEPPAFVAKQYADDRGIRQIYADRILARPRGIIYRTLDKQDVIKIGGDGVHPTVESHYVIAEQAWRLLSTATFLPRGPILG